MLPVLREYSPCYRRKSSLLFFLRRRAKKPKPRGPAVGESAQAFSWRVLAAQTARQILHAFSGLSFFSLLDGRITLFCFCEAAIPLKLERSCLTEKSSLEIWAGHDAAWLN
jgi:hypothetical protein